MKFLRNYEIRIKSPGNIVSSNPDGSYNYDNKGKTIVINPPISCTFDVNRAVMSSVNSGTITLTNLSPDTRDAIYKDKYSTTEYWQFILMAGYGDELYEILRGNINEAYSYKQGTEWFTYIDVFDGSYAVQNGFISETIGAGVSLKDMAIRVIHTMPEVLAGLMGTPADAKKTSPRGQVLLGSSWEQLQEMTGGNASIDGGYVNIMAKDDAVSADVFVLDSDLIAETPKRREQFLEVKTSVLCPEIRMWYICELRSMFTRYNGQYSVYGVKHSATISGASAGEASSMISLYKGEAPFIMVNK
jgi:hypothetical protein